MNTVTCKIGFVGFFNQEYLRDCLNWAARKAHVDLEIVEVATARTFPGTNLPPFYVTRPVTINGAEVEVCVSSGNQGSLDDFCGFYLAKLVDSGAYRLDVEVATLEYIERVNQWLRREEPCA